MDYAASLYFIRRHNKPSTFNKEKYSYIKIMCNQIIKKQALIKKPKGGLREATQHNNYDFPSTWSAAVVPFQ